MGYSFSAIRQPKISEQIVDQVIQLIKDSRIRPGEKLPSEKEFIEQLGVGRSSLREAINVLETLGYIENRKRKGLYIRSVTEPILTDPLERILEEDQSKLPHLYDLRKDIELAAAFKAANMRTADDLNRLKTYIDQMEVDLRQDKLTLSYDLEFHLGVAQATHNFLRLHILNKIFELSNRYIEYIRTEVSQDAANLPIIFDQHLAIYRTIEAGKAREARDCMAHHLSWVETMIDHLTLTPPPEAPDIA